MAPNAGDADEVDAIMLQIRDRSRCIMRILRRQAIGMIGGGYGDAQALGRLREERRQLQAKLPPLRLVGSVDV